VATFCIYTLTKRCREEYPLLTGIEYKPNIPAKEVTEVEEDLIETLKLPELPELTDLEDF
jgi:hypothetical protein